MQCNAEPIEDGAKFHVSLCNIYKLSWDALLFSKLTK